MTCKSCSRRALCRVSLAFILFALVFAAFCLIGSAFVSYVDRFAGTEETPAAAAPFGSAVSPVIIIDAGHGGEDGGAVGINGAVEKELTLLISYDLCAILKAAGYTAVPTRTEDISLYDRSVDYRGRKKVLDLAARLNIASSYQYAVFVSLHMNAFPQTQYSGLQVYFSPSHPGSRELALCVQRSCQKYLQPDNDRKIKPSAGGIFLLDRLTCPAVLVECGFLSNPDECRALCDSNYRRALALLIYMSVGEYLSSGGADAY